MGSPFSTAGIDAVAFAFANAPVGNPDNEEGIDLHVDYAHADTIPAAPLWNSNFSEFDEAKNTFFGTADERRDPNWEYIQAAKKRAFRYCIFANQLESDDNPPSHLLGRGELPGNDFVVTLGGLDEWGSRTVACTFMHELGHNLGLGHGGNRPDGLPDHTNYKPNYISVMNYGFDQFRDTGDRPLLPDYSRQETVVLNEAAINENLPFFWNNSPNEQGTVIHGYRVPGEQPRVGHLFVVDLLLQDWNHDGRYSDSVAIDLNWLGEGYPGGAASPSPGDVMTSQNDWDKIQLPIGTDGDFADGAHETMNYEEISEEIVQWHREHIPPSPINAAELNSVQMTTGLILAGDVDALRAGDQMLLQARSGYGERNIDLHNMELLLQATTGLANPVQMDVMVCSHLSDAGGIAELRLRNWTSGLLELVGSYETSTEQTSSFVTGIECDKLHWTWWQYRAIYQVRHPRSDPGLHV